MGKFDGVLLTADFDGTVRAEDENFVSKENIDAIEYFCDNGGYFTLNTGRDIQFYRFVTDMVTPNAPVIFANGGTIYDGFEDKTYFTTALDGDIRPELKEVIKRYPFLRVEARKDNCVYVLNRGRYPRPYDNCAFDIVEIDMDELEPPYNKVEIFDPDGFIKSGTPDTEWIVDFLSKRFAAFAAGRIIDVMRKGYDKGTGALMLCDILGVSREHLYTMGDSDNDIPMLKVAKRAFAPENAYPSVMAQDVTVVSNAKNHAVKAVIEILDKMY